MAFIYASITYAAGNVLHQYFPEYLLYENPYAFLQSRGIDVQQDIVYLSNLSTLKEGPLGCHKGTFYQDSQTTYFIKQCSIFHEFTGSKFMNLILGTRCTPIVKIVSGAISTTASIKLHNFHRLSEVDTNNKVILGEVDLAIAQDYIALTDRSKRNLGYLTKGSHTLIAARIDCDNSFRFANNSWNTNPGNTDHLNLTLLHASIQKYPRDEVIKSLNKIINIPDEAIVLTSFHSCVALAYTGFPIDLETSFILAHNLIERKAAFRQVLDHLISMPSQPTQNNNSVKKQSTSHKKATNKKNKKVKKKRKAKKKNRHTNHR